MKDVLARLGIKDANLGTFNGEWIGKVDESRVLNVESSIDGSHIAKVYQASEEDYDAVIGKAHEKFLKWRMFPAPKRGEIVRQIGEELRKHKSDLGKLVTFEMGKIVSEGEGEVQEMIDIADFAVGLSRQLYGLTMPSERSLHRMYEQWHPLGVVGVISAFNFPVAVWAWNAMIALVCGDTCVWKPSSTTPLTAIATMNIVDKVIKRNGWDGILGLVIGSGSVIGERLINDKRVPLISATGSTPMGYKVNNAIAKRMGRAILELGGNNAIIAMPDANIDMLVRGVLFAAVGTAGQRCTSLRRLIVHESIIDDVTDRLLKAYKSISIGNPLDDGTLMGPLVDINSVNVMMNALAKIKEQGGKVIAGGNRIDKAGYYVEPTIVKALKTLPMLIEETFAPILYIVPFGDIDEAIEIHNNVPQGLSSAIFTTNMLSAEKFLSPEGSDCGIANVNIGTSGAEIGGAFGGEKETGGGRESGSDSWKQYMRRQTCTINFGDELPLAQGVKFDID